MAELKISDDLIKAIKKALILDIYPIGSLYLSITTTNPGTYLGGTWQLCGSARYMIGYDPNNEWFNKPGSDKGTGSGPGSWNTNASGATTTGSTTLNINQIPSHNHSDGDYGYGKRVADWRVVTDSATDGFALTLSGSYGTKYPIGYLHNQGGNQGHTHSLNKHTHFHVSPYMVVCIWERIA